MKGLHRHLPILVLLTLVAAAISACGGGGGGAGEGEPGPQAPVITRVEIVKASDPDHPLVPDPQGAPIAVKVGERLTYQVHYRDADLDADLLFFTRYFPASRNDPFIDETIEITPQTTALEMYTPEADGFFGAFVGTWRLVFQIEDARGLQSDPHELLVAVERPPVPLPPEPPESACQGTAPAITGAFIYSAEAPDTPLEPVADVITVAVNQDLLWQVDYSDADGDALFVKFDRHYPADAALPTLSSTFRIAQTEAQSVYRHPEVGFFGDFPGAWRLNFTVIDACQLSSETFTLWVDVIRP